MFGVLFFFSDQTDLNAYQRYLQILGFACGSLSLVYLVVLSWRFVFESGAALWVEDDVMVYLHRWFQSAHRNDIECVSSGTVRYSDYPAVIVRMKGGGTIEIPCIGLSQQSEEIVARLKRELALS
jgi:hypothetical protein